MDFDPLTEAFPTRTTQEEEETDAEPSAALLFEEPTITWAPVAKETIRKGKLRTQMMVVATGPAACTLLHYCASSRQVIGSIVMVEHGMAGNALRPSPDDSSCYIYSVGAVSELLLVSCQYSVKPERAHALVQGLIAHVDAERTVVMAGAPASEVQALPAGDADTPVFVLHTDAWRVAATEGLPSVPVLPSGNVISGLPAKLMSMCQARRMKACLLVLRQPAPMPDAQSLQILCQAALATLTPFNTAVAALGLADKGSLRSACAHAEQLQWESGISGAVYL